jgi:hypothetical protein
MELSRLAIAGALALVMAAAPAAWAGGYKGPDETKEYRQPCPACPTCPACPVVEEDPTWLRAELKGGVLMGVGNTSNKIDWGGMGEAVFGVKVYENIDIEGGYLFANNGVDNPGHQSGSQDIHCFRGGPRINGAVGPRLTDDIGRVELYGALKAGYCNANAVGSGFTNNNFVVGPGAGIMLTILPNLLSEYGTLIQFTAGTDMIWFTGHNVKENTVITPNAGVRLMF